MRPRRSREISVFSMSMLDVISSALGAFLILFIITMQTTQRARSQLSECEKEPCGDRCPCEQHCPEEAVDCQKICPCPEPDPQAPFVAILLQWSSAATDVDLFVTRPGQSAPRHGSVLTPGSVGAGVCWFRNLDGCGPGAKLVKDYEGMGVTETFIVNQVRPGAGPWTVQYMLYGGGPVTVQGTAYYPRGEKRLPPITLRPPSDTKKFRTVFTFRADAEGNLTIDTSP